MKLPNPVLVMYAHLHNLDVPDGIGAVIAFAAGGDVYVLGNVAPPASIEIMQKAIAAIRGEAPAPVITTGKAN